jgi:hypothetical protein
VTAAEVALVAALLSANRLQENPVVEFMQDRLIESENGKVLVVELLEKFNASPYRSGHPVGLRRFKALLESAGFSLTERTYVNGRQGIAVAGMEFRVMG